MTDDIITNITIFIDLITQLLFFAKAFNHLVLYERVQNTSYFKSISCFIN